MRIKNLLKISLTTLTLLAALALHARGNAAEAVHKSRVLLVTGDDVSVHNWAEVSQATKEALEATGRFEVRICEDP